MSVPLEEAMIAAKIVSTPMEVTPAHATRDMPRRGRLAMVR